MTEILDSLEIQETPVNEGQQDLEVLPVWTELQEGLVTPEGMATQVDPDLEETMETLVPPDETVIHLEHPEHLALKDGQATPAGEATLENPVNPEHKALQEEHLDYPDILDALELRERAEIQDLMVC